ncbi:hypothetical protein PR048_014468 [Dryococelus australis]|uniref:PiggyBac transposable element-derived protein domain-containing protein n=1 Tax=Dryococelus australis TaxID=614101 RepID=A0ABQ9HEA5_9NEOP|nr:hypothetical protein PR048_014468 [Dryococelus australis]
MKILYCGTLRVNRRGIPQGFANKMKWGENIVKILTRMDKHSVLMISSDPTHNTNMIPDYNKAKKGANLSDQMAYYRTVLRKSLNWYRKVVLELILGTTVANVWVVYNISDKKLGITRVQAAVGRTFGGANTYSRRCGSRNKQEMHTYS